MLDDELMPTPPGGEIAPYQQPTRSSLDYSNLSLPVRSDAPGAMNHHNTGASPTLFGQPMQPGTTPQQAQQLVDVLIQNFATAMQRTPGYDIAISWFRNNAFAPVPRERASHNYNLTGFRSPPADKPHVDSFLNHMARNQVPQASVQAMLQWWYVSLAQPQQQQPAPRQLSDAALEARDNADRIAGLNELRVRWGREFDLRMRVVGQHFENLPAALREHIDNSVLANGSLVGNSPDFIEALYRDATGGALPNNGSSLTAEIATLEGRMRTDRKNWNRDEQAQARLRRLYDLRDGGN